MLIFKENGGITMMSILTGPTLSSQDGMRQSIQHMVSEKGEPTWIQTCVPLLATPAGT